MEIGLTFIAFACLLLLMYAAQRYARKQKELYQPHLATVLAVSQTSQREGSLQEIEAQIEIAGRKPRRATVRQWMDPKVLPRAGQVVRVVNQDGALVLFGFSAERPADPTPQAAQAAHRGESTVGVLTAAELTQELRTQGQLAIATVLNARTIGAGITRFSLEIDAIGRQSRTVELDQSLPADTFSTDERAYLLVNSHDADVMYLLAPAKIGGQRLPREMNRLDPYVLGPELLKNGARARGTVLSANQIHLSPEYEVRGFTRFRLAFRIEPETDHPAYEAEQVITLTRPEKIAVMATPGALVPLRFDTINRETFTMDSLAMGYGDPYAEALNLFREQLSTAGAA